MEERVRRLRAAHLAAKQHSVSKMDKVIGSSRRLFDAAHKFTVMGLIGFSGMFCFVPFVHSFIPFPCPVFYYHI